MVANQLNHILPFTRSSSWLYSKITIKDVSFIIGVDLCNKNGNKVVKNDFFRLSFGLQLELFLVHISPTPPLRGKREKAPLGSDRTHDLVALLFF